MRNKSLASALFDVPAELAFGFGVEKQRSGRKFGGVTQHSEQVFCRNSDELRYCFCSFVLLPSLLTSNAGSSGECRMSPMLFLT